MMNRTCGLAVTFMLAVMLVACGGGNGDAEAIPTLTNDATVRVTSRAHVDVDIRAGSPVRVRENTLYAPFPRHEAELASASALTPAHGHGSPNPAIERDGNSFVVRDLVFFMSGRWELRLGLIIDAREDEAIVAVDVP